MSTMAMFMTAVLPAARAVPSRASCGRARRGRAPLRCDAVAADWREKARPITPGGVYPAKEHCSSCGLCDTYYVAHVKEACAFLGDGMSRVETLEPTVHGRGRDLSNDELRLGVVDEVFYARKTAPVEGAQWTGIVTSIAIEMLTSGKVEGVVCVASQPDDPMRPRPILATTVEEILSSKGVKPSLSPNLEVLAEVEARGLKRLLFIGVGCAVTALRGVEPYLGLDALYVVGTNCTDNGRAETLPKFLAAASDDPATVTGYEFMQDYRVHLKHADGRFEKVPYFCLPANDLKDVIAPSCYSCFDYVNGLADLVVGYMGVPMSVGVEMTAHPQYVTVRNARGKELFDSVRETCEVTPSVSSGNRTPFVVQTVVADDEATLGRGPPEPAPRAGGERAGVRAGEGGAQGEGVRHVLAGLPHRAQLPVRQAPLRERRESEPARPGLRAAHRGRVQRKRRGGCSAGHHRHGARRAGYAAGAAVRADARAGRGRRARRIAVRGNRPERHRRRVGVRSGLGDRLEGHGGVGPETIM
jgi:7-hydroxymethyl chlorophyll a reductase